MDRSLGLRAALFSLMLLLATTVPAQTPTTQQQDAAGVRVDRSYGFAYDHDSGKYLYTEVHTQRYEGKRWVSGTIRYYTPDGTLLGDKTLDFSSDPTIPVFKTELLREHYSEAITAVTPETVTMEKFSDGKLKTATIERKGTMAADSGFHNLLVAHFKDLLDGRTVRFRFVVASQLDTYRFRVMKTGDTTFDGKPAVVLRVEPDSLLRVLAGPLTMIYSRDDPHLLQYEGLSNVDDPATGSAYNVRIVYPSQPPPDAPKNLPPLQ